MSYSTLADRVWSGEGTSSLVRNAALVALGVALVGIAAQIKIPMWPVPMTLQTLAVLAIGIAYGAKLGGATLLAYVLIGLAGAPIFANGIGGYLNEKGMLISTGGYLIGFVIAAYVVGWLIERGWGKSLLLTVVAAVIGGALLYIPGLAWLAVWANKVAGVASADAWPKALEWGLYPFIIGDLLKAAIAGLGVGAVANVIGKRG